MVNQGKDEPARMYSKASVLPRSCERLEIDIRIRTTTTDAKQTCRGACRATRGAAASPFDGQPSGLRQCGHGRAW